MGTETFSDFLELLDRNGELARIKARVNPILEIAEIADRMSKSPAPHGNSELDRSPASRLGGRALLFENVEGSDIPVAINTFGSYYRINQALGTDNLESLAARVGIREIVRFRAHAKLSAGVGCAGGGKAPQREKWCQEHRAPQGSADTSQDGPPLSRSRSSHSALRESRRHTTSRLWSSSVADRASR